MKKLYFGKQPSFNRFRYSRRGGHPAPGSHGDLVADPRQVLERIQQQYKESRRPVPVRIAYVACNALSGTQQRMVMGVIRQLLDDGQLDIYPQGVVPVSVSKGASHEQ